MPTINKMFIVVSILLLASVEATVCSGEETNAPLETENIETHAGQTVILLHGMGRGRASLWVLDTRLKQAGFRTLNFSYGGQGYSIEEIAQQLFEFIEENVRTDTYHLIAHSLGNLVIRVGFTIGYPEGLGRIVMLAPPNQPTELARALRDNPIYKWFTSEGGWQFTSDAFYAQLPVPDVEFGIIAGNRGQSVLLREPNDGVITVESTRLEGMADWVVVPHAHTFIMNSRTVAELCVLFIENGKFPPMATGSQDVEPDAGDDYTVNTEKAAGDN